jgi:hypothetical protein
VDAEAAAGLPPGWYLVGAAPPAGALGTEDLAHAVQGLFAQVRP